MDYNKLNNHTTATWNYQNISHNGNCITFFPHWVQTIRDMPFIVLEMQMLLIFCITQLLHRLILKPIGMPPLVSQMLTGLAIGPGGLGRSNIFRKFFVPKESLAVTKCITMLAYAFSSFFVATQMDFTIIKRTSKRTMMIGLLSTFSALIANSITSVFLQSNGKNKDLEVVAASLPSTAHPSLVRVVTDLGIANSEIGRLTLAAALCAEFISVMTTIVVNNLFQSLDKKGFLNGIRMVFGIVLLLLFLVFVLRPFLLMLMRATPKDRPVKDTYLLLAILSVLGGALYTEHIGQHLLIGSYMVGCILPDGPPLGSALVDKFGSLISGVLFPFFVSFTAAKIEFSSINLQSELFFGIGILVFVNSVTKIIVCFTCALYSNMTHQDAISFASLMLFKGFMELGTISWLHEAKQMSRECYSLLALHTILMSALVPAIVNFLYDPMRKYGGYQIRDVMHLKPNGTLRMVTCILRSDNISSISNLIRIMNPIREVPIDAHILHLMKLAGRCQPLFISHDVQKKQSSYRSYSDEVIWHFDRMQTYNMGVLSTHVYTALTQPDAMHEYICTLSLDKVVSIIVLPFHRKFGIDGTVAYDDHQQRILNTSVLSKSPCSIAVLVDRSHINLRRPDASPINVVTTTTEVLYSVAVIFIGGNDDREALAFGQRMKRGMRIRLTVIQLAAPNDGEEFLNPLDSKAIDNLYKNRFNEGTQQVMYTQVTVKDGIETALKLRSMVHDYDLIIVGRRFGLDCLQTSSLSETSEIKELGVLGDLLASPDLKCKTSVLVVQQQRQWTLRSQKKNIDT